MRTLPPPLASALPTAAVPAASQSARLTKLAAEAVHQSTLGISYSYGGGHGSRPSPLNSHVDCSGFVREMYNYAFGVDIGGGSGDTTIRTSGMFVPTSHPVPGDVLLMGNSGHAPAYHAGIYVGISGGHRSMVSSPTTGQNIKMATVDGYWAHDLMGYWHYRGATAADSGSAAPPRVAGFLDLASGIPGGVSVVGWAFDPQRRTAGTTVAVTIDHRLIAYLPTSTPRADVNRVMRTRGIHGFRAGIPYAVGRHTVCVTARPAATSSTAVVLGCRTVVVPGPVNGFFDQAIGAGRTFVVRGWAYDPVLSASASMVRVILDGQVVVGIRTSIPRPDVNHVFRIAGSHGFAGRIAAAPGRHTVCVVAQPTSAGSYARSLGCRAIAVR